MATEHDSGDELDIQGAADFLEIPASEVLELIDLRALSAVARDGAQFLRVEDLQAFAAEQARRRPFMEEIGRIGSEQLENEYRRGLI